MTDEVGFKPSRECPCCGKRHLVQYQYFGVDMLVCPKMDENKIMLINEEKAAEELARLMAQGRFSYIKEKP